MHIPVMLKEAIQNLDFSVNGIYIDCTLGGGGYSEEIIKKLKNQNILISFDLDIKTIQEFAHKLEVEQFKLEDKINFGLNNSEVLNFENKEIDLKVILVNENFAKIKELMKFLYNVSNLQDLNNLKVRGIIADLGLNSDQLDTESGFSFQNLDQELDMRLDKNSNVKALDILKISNVEELTKLFEKYADLKGSYKLSKLIKEELKDNRDLTVGDLVQIIDKAFGKNNAVRFNLHSKVFQALRIVVNSEYENLENLLKDGFEILDNNGRFGIVTFHSGEDRIVKHYFKELESNSLILTNTDLQVQPILPSEEEVNLNNRSRSAKFRYIVKK